MVLPGAWYRVWVVAVGGGGGEVYNVHTERARARGGGAPISDTDLGASPRESTDLGASPNRGFDLGESPKGKASLGGAGPRGQEEEEEEEGAEEGEEEEEEEERELEVTAAHVRATVCVCGT
eukprot:775937-Rhodomonas_salina.1